MPARLVDSGRTPGPGHKPAPGPLHIPTAPGSVPQAASPSADPRAEPLPASRTPNTPGRLAAARRAATPQRPAPPEALAGAGPAGTEVPYSRSTEGRVPEARPPAAPCRERSAGDRHTPEEPERIRNRRESAAGAVPPSFQQLSPPPSSAPSGGARPGQEAAQAAPSERHDRPGAPAPPGRRRRRTAPVSRGPGAGATGWSPESSAGRDGSRRSARGPAVRRTC